MKTFVQTDKWPLPFTCDSYQNQNLLKDFHSAFSLHNYPNFPSILRGVWGTVCPNQQKWVGLFFSCMLRLHDCPASGRLSFSLGFSMLCLQMSAGCGEPSGAMSASACHSKGKFCSDSTFRLTISNGISCFADIIGIFPNGTKKGSHFLSFLPRSIAISNHGMFQNKVS